MLNNFNRQNIFIILCTHSGLYGPGSLIWLSGSSITAMAQDITLAGQQVDAMGQLIGERKTVTVAVDHEGDETSRYSVELPAASAGLMVVKVTVP